MRHAWIDASAGVAGDMLLGALLDAGADRAAVQAAVDAVVPGSVAVTMTSVTRAGLRATKAEVDVRAPDQPHRHWATIRGLIDDADLAEPVRERARAVFARLAEAEARVHGIEPDQVHFHEVGALDSIADVVGVAAALHDLGVDTVSAGPVALGSGTVRTAHGVLPVPVPAVVELAQDWRVSAGGPGELTTPTGMALVVTLAERCQDLPDLQVRGVGVGAGTRDPAGRANVTRVVLGDLAARSADPTSPALLLETNIDDLDPRLWPEVLQRLLRAGADDAWLVPILGKKGRPGHVLTVLGPPDRADVLRTEMMAGTSTFGVRQTAYRKYALPRAWFDVAVGNVAVAVKVAHRDGVIFQVSPEFDSVAAAAVALGITQHEALTAAAAAAATAGLVTGVALPEGGRSTMAS
ncbi:MAG TPA: nickel pincer cofactor biosynthesis protein LarC [Propionibacteriaceae bacterium]|nr:nickel pincer cofactor biosynthesis protein LarC [Propionibacteriaceae bacterium]